MATRLVVIVIAMFGFGYALVPIYEKICEITGINVLTQQDRNAARIVANTQVDTSRTIEVIFDANERGNFRFTPETNRMVIHPGELITINYDIVNSMSRASAGQAIPSYLPSKAAQHFTKLECFCFEQQPFEAGESKRFPVVFVINPKLPADVHTITMSYTFFEVAGATAMNTQ